MKYQLCYTSFIVKQSKFYTEKYQTKRDTALM